MSPSNASPNGVEAHETSLSLKGTARRSRQTEVSDLRWSYREQAAVQVFFDLTKLQVPELSLEKHQEAVQGFLADCTVVYDEDGYPRWMLRSDVRKAALQHLSSQGKLVDMLLQNEPVSTDSLQKALNAYILGKALPIGEQDLDELAGTLQVIDWLEGSVSGLPAEAEVRSYVERERLLKPFRLLIKHTFCGRDEELAKLREYVGVLPPRNKGSLFVRGVQEFLSLHEKPPLLIHGPGGIGKSTLIAELILEHVELAPDQRFPFVYLDFDHPDLRFDEPLTLLVEAFRQLAIQYPQAKPTWERISRQWEQRLDYEDSRLRDIESVPNISRLSGYLEREWARYMRDFKQLLTSLEAGEKPLLLVLDSFEEVQYRSRDFVDELWRFLNELQELVPRLRTVLAGRAPIANFRTNELLLKGLNEVDALKLLKANQITDPKVASQIIAKVGYSPLSLILAAGLLTKEGVTLDEILDLKTRSLFFFRVQENLVQGQLYRRILAHIHSEDPRVRSLAHPGLLLRRVTPDLILHVLAGPCDVEVEDQEDAEYLFRELLREVSLVEVADDGSLRHRADVRRVMLDLLRQDEPAKVEQIQRQAIDYYLQQDGEVARAEEIYHRLSLGQEPQEVDERWQDGVGHLLRRSIDELPAAAQTYLASKIGGLQLPEETWAQAAEVDRERSSAHQARELLARNRPEEALKLLSKFDQPMVGSLVPLLKAQAFQALGDLRSAREAVQSGIGGAVPNSRELLELLLLSASLDEQEGDLEAVHEALARAADVAERLQDDLVRLQITVRRLRLARLTLAYYDPQLLQLGQEVTALWSGLADEQLLSQISLIRDVASQMGNTQPEVVKRAMQLCGLGANRPAKVPVLVEALAAWDERRSTESGQPPGMLARGIGVWTGGSLRESWTLAIEQSDWSRVAYSLQSLLQSEPWIAPVTSAVVDLLKSPLVLREDQARAFQKALLDAFTSEELAELLDAYFPLDLSQTSTGGTAADVIADLVNQAESYGQVPELVTAALSERPSSRPIRQIAEELGLVPTAPEAGAGPTLRLSGGQIEALHLALLGAFTEEQLELLLERGLGVSLDQISASGPPFSRFLQLVEWANAQDRVGELLAAALEVQPGHLSLKEFAYAWEETIDAPGGRVLADRAAATVCRIEIPGDVPLVATGFLVSDKCILTSYSVVSHVQQSSSQADSHLEPGTGLRDVLLRFDFKASPDGTILSQGQVYQVGEGFLAHSPPDELDFALLRAEGSPGQDPIAGLRRGKARGWLELATHRRLQPGEPLWLAHHPYGGGLKIASSTVLQQEPAGRRITYGLDTSPGSAGAPCLSALARVVALHSGPTREPQIKTGIPIRAIVAELEAQGIWPLGE